MEVEGFAEPARSDGTGVGIVQAVHIRQRSLLLSSPPVKLIGQSPGQSLIAVPRLIQGAVRRDEFPASDASGGCSSTFVDGGVVRQDS